MELVVLSIIFGACIGSFINVVVFRLPRNESFVTGRSKCPKCQKRLGFLDLFPIFSWILLRGKCRHCFENISIRYPIVELITSVFFLSCIYSYGFNQFSESLTFNLVSGWILLSLLITLTIIDIDTMTLPNLITYTGSIVGLFLIFIKDIFFNKSFEPVFLEHFFAFFITYIFIALFGYFLKLLLRKEAFGGGDSKLIAMTAAWLGFSGVEVIVTLSFLLGGLFSAISLISGKIKRGDFIPFGPFICISTFLVWMLGSNFWYDLLGNIFWWKYL